MRRLLYYHLLTALDLVRLWPSVQQQVIIVAGICLPILMLLGLKNGHVAELRRELLTSPTGREVVFWSAQHGELLRPSTVDAFSGSLGGVDLVIPELHRVVSLAAIDSAGSRRIAQSVTLYSTRPGDPILAQHQADVVKNGEQSLVLAEEVAKSLGVVAGDVVAVTVQRVHEGVSETATIDLRVKWVVALGAEIGYVDIAILTAMEQYVQGFQVRGFGWPAFAAAAADEYTGYLIFCEKTSLLTEEDLRTLRDRGFLIEQIQEAELASLYGLLVSDAAEKVTVYRLAAHGSGRDHWQRLRIAPSEISRVTEADDVVVPWSEPRTLAIDGVEYRTIGLSLPDRTWLKLYLRDGQFAHRYDTDTFTIAFPTAGGLGPAKVSLSWAKDVAIPLQVVTPSGDLRSRTKLGKTPGNADVGNPTTSEVVDSDGNQPAMQTPTQAKPDAGATSDQSDQRPAESPKELPLEPRAKSPEMLPTDNVEGPLAEPRGKDSAEDSHKKEFPRGMPDELPEGEDLLPKKESTSKRLDAKIERPAAEKATDMTPERGTTLEGSVVEKSAATAPPDISEPQKPERSAGAGSSAIHLSTENSSGVPIAVVPVDLLAYLHAFGAGRVEYDAARRLFVPTPREPTFERARLYATTIDDVPDVVRKLKERQFAVMSQSTRISEIHQQDFSLGLLVLIVGAGVFLFGVVTVVTVLLDSTERKRGTIGILRVMGVPRTAVFYMVFLRAAVIGSIAAGLTIGLGYLTGHVLGWEPSPNTTWVQWKPVIKVIIKPDDILLVVAGALTCCGLGSLIPAFRASRLDPFDAIVEGRFR